MGLTGWDSYDSWDNPDPTNAIVINSLQQAIKERLFILNIQPAWKFTEKEFIKDTNILHDVYLQILKRFILVIQQLYQKIKLFC